jgi:hypothetical protein
VCCLLSTGAGPSSQRDDGAVEDGFISLFNGKDLTGWRIGRNPGGEALDGKVESSDHRFAARDGAIVIQGAPKIEDVYTTREFNKPFVLRLEFRAAPKANSGLYLRGTQLQVRDYPTVGPYKDLKSFKNGGWNFIEVTVKPDPSGKGSVAECRCNGELLEPALKIPESGGIGLQSETNQIEYRRIRLKETP